MNKYERLEIVSDGANQEPDLITGVSIVKHDHFVTRVGMYGYLIEIMQSEHQRIVDQLDKLQYDVYVVENRDFFS